MALPTSGPLSLSDIQGEFGGSNPISLSEYYAGGGLVAPGTTGTYGAVPSSGEISIRNFYGTSSAFTPVTNTYNSGSGTETVPTGATQLVITAYGSGGDGAAFDVSSGGGGGGGAYCVKTVSIVSGDYGVGLSWAVNAPGSNGASSVTGTIAAGALAVSAGAGQNGGLNNVGGAGGTASGGDTNTNGDPGGAYPGGAAAGPLGGAYQFTGGQNGNPLGGGGAGDDTGSAGVGTGAYGRIVFAWT